MSIAKIFFTVSAALLLLSPLSAARADDRPAGQSSNGAEYRDIGPGYDRPLRVFVRFAGEGRGHKSSRSGRSGRHGGRNEATGRLNGKKFADFVRHYFGKTAAPNMQLVFEPRYADLILKVREVDYDFDFLVTKRERRSKKYKHKNRYRGGKCGLYKRAYYDRITERGIAHFQYDIKMRGTGGYRDYFSLNGEENERFRYGENLLADTNCGRHPADVYPNKTVAKYFDRAGPEHRRKIRGRVRRDVARRLALTLQSAADRYIQRSYEGFE